VEEPIISAPEESQTSSFQCEMHAYFFYMHGIVPYEYEYIPKGETVNQDFSSYILWHLQKDVRRKQPEKWRTGNGFLHHDIVSAHFAKTARLLFRTLLTLQICPPATFFFLQN
jgi:hypothetical protein